MTNADDADPRQYPIRPEESALPDDADRLLSLLGHREPALPDNADDAHAFPGEPSEKLYNKGCRCAGCTACHAEQARRRYHAHKNGNFTDRRKKPGSRNDCGCSKAEAILRDPDTPALSIGSQVALWQLATHGEITLSELADLTGYSQDVTSVQLSYLVDAGLAVQHDETYAMVA